jgi:autotransporter-associated beta strand protein
MDVDAFLVYKGSASPTLKWGASGGGGTATWNVNNSANWYDGIAASQWQDLGGTDYAAEFGGTAGTVTLGANVKANRLIFTTTGYTVRSTNASNLLTLNGTTAWITTNAGVTATISSIIAGTAGLVKDGPGTLQLTGTASTRNGPTTVAAGTLSLGNGTANAKLADTAAVSIAHGAILHLNYSGTDTVNALSFGGIARPPGVYSAATSSFITGSGTLTVTTGPATDYAGWEAFHALAGGQTGDDDQDGLDNLDEYAFGLNPKNGSSSNPISVPLDKTTGTFHYTRRHASLTPLTYSVWYSTDLAGWSEDTGAVQGLPTVSGEVETVPVTLTGALLANPKLFIQVRAE